VIYERERKNLLEKYFVAGCIESTPVILATWEVKIGRIAVQGQPRQKVYETSSTNKKLGMVECTYHSRHVGSINRISVQDSPGLNVRPYLEK
jgi:hypothetical protein